MKKVFYSIAVAALFALASATMTYAGGWSVTTLDKLPTEIVVGEPVTFGFTILQHGKTPWVSDEVQVRAFHHTGAKLTVGATPDGTQGHYTATMTFDRPGKWTWAVASGLLPEWQPMPDLTVLESSAANDSALTGAPLDSTALAAKNGKGGLPFSVPLALGIVGLIGSGGGLLYWLRNRSR